MESNQERVRKANRKKTEEIIKTGKGGYDGAHSTCVKVYPTSHVNKEEALKCYNTHTLTTEYTKPIEDGTGRWLWTIRDKKANEVGYILGTPKYEQKHDKTGKIRNNAWKGVFDFMELREKKIAG